MSDRGDVVRFASTPAVRWLPRVLAGAVLIAGLVIAMRFGGGRESAVVQRVRWALSIGVAVVALWVARSGPETRLVAELDREELRLGVDDRMTRIDYPSIDSLRWAPPFAASRRWIPALLVMDDEGRSWRIPALIADGDRLVDELLARSGRDDLRAWAEAGRLGVRMGRWRSRIRVIYVVALALVVASALAPMQ